MKTFKYYPFCSQLLAPYNIVMVCSHSAFIVLEQNDVTSGTDQSRPRLHVLGNDRSKDRDTMFYLRGHRQTGDKRSE